MEKFFLWFYPKKIDDHSERNYIGPPPSTEPIPGPSQGHPPAPPVLGVSLLPGPAPDTQSSDSDANVSDRQSNISVGEDIARIRLESSASPPFFQPGLPAPALVKSPSFAFPSTSGALQRTSTQRGPAGQLSTPVAQKRTSTRGCSSSLVGDTSLARTLDFSSTTPGSQLSQAGTSGLQERNFSTQLHCSLGRLFYLQSV